MEGSSLSKTTQTMLENYNLTKAQMPDLLKETAQENLPHVQEELKKDPNNKELCNFYFELRLQTEPEKALEECLSKLKPNDARERVFINTMKKYLKTGNVLCNQIPTEEALTTPMNLPDSVANFLRENFREINEKQEEQEKEQRETYEKHKNTNHRSLEYILASIGSCAEKDREKIQKLRDEVMGDEARYRKILMQESKINILSEKFLKDYNSVTSKYFKGENTIKENDSFSEVTRKLGVLIRNHEILYKDDIDACKSLIKNLEANYKDSIGDAIKEYNSHKEFKSEFCSKIRRLIEALESQKNEDLKTTINDLKSIEDKVHKSRELKPIF
jgi:hypothetical protein